MIESSWHNLYGEGWRDITKESFSHPAKFSRALIRFIYKHAIGEGWVKPGDTVIDPFGGIGLGGIDSMQYGLHWIGIELERHFHDMGNGCECTGVNKEDWIRYQGRLERIRYKDDRHICPECLANARAIIEDKQRKNGNRNGNGKKSKKVLPLPPFQKIIENRPLMKFESLSTSYKRNSGKIPYTKPHYYKGNIDLWNEKRLPGTATLLQGDSRKLIEVIQKADLNVSSPPYIDSIKERSDATVEGDRQHIIRRGGNPDSPGILPMREYGRTPGQLASMSPGNINASISSPPFLQQSGGTNVTSEAGPLSDPRLIKRHSAGNAAANAYGEDSANLGNMPVIALSSPPYADSIKPQGDGIDWDKVKEGGHKRTLGRGAIADGYSENGENLGNMKDDPKKYNLAISSPPYADIAQSGGTKGLIEHGTGLTGGKRCFDEYGNNPAQLGKMESTEDNYNLAVSSPPFSEPNNQPCIGQGVRKDLEAIGKNPTERYGSSEGNLGNMDMGISSPPFEGIVATQDPNFLTPGEQGKKNPSKSNMSNYGETPENIGNQSGNDFWSAARIIIEQVYQILKPGGHSIWITKNYIKAGKIIPFSEQWQKLCEAVGFETVHIHRAWLVEEKGTQYDLFGEAHTKTVERKSFFRRLLEKKGAPRIDFEQIICMIKPE